MWKCIHILIPASIADDVFRLVFYCCNIAYTSNVVVVTIVDRMTCLSPHILKCVFAEIGLLRCCISCLDGHVLQCTCAEMNIGQYV